MPKSLEEFARSRVRHDGYGSVSEYFRELVRIDQRYNTAKREPPERLDATDLLPIVPQAKGRFYKSREEFDSRYRR